MSDKSPRQQLSQKSAKSIKEKRAAKQAKQAETATPRPASSVVHLETAVARTAPSASVKRAGVSAPSYFQTLIFPVAGA